MTISVIIRKGWYRTEQISGTFQVVKPYQTGAKGGFITIRNPNPVPGKGGPIQRITVEEGDFTLIGDDGQELESHVTIDVDSKSGLVMAGTNYEEAFTSQETEDEAMERIAASFLMLDKITDACARGIIRGLVVSGPPGIGKSFGVEKQLDVANMFRKVAGQDPMYEIVSGGISAIGLYQKLYFNRHKENTLCFDDADGVFEETESLNLLKAALNSGDKRRICWNKESRVLNFGGLPEQFDFEGSIIFLTNIDFEKSIAKGSKIGAHLEALMSRSHYLDLEISSTRDKLLRIKQLCRDGMLNPYAFTAQQESDIIAFVFTNAEYMREISLRAVKKLADLVQAEPSDWLEMAEATLLTKEAFFRRMLEKKRVIKE